MVLVVHAVEAYALNPQVRTCVYPCMCALHKHISVCQVLRMFAGVMNFCQTTLQKHADACLKSVDE